MPFALAVTMVTAVALSLIILGTLGAVLAAWQLCAWLAAGGVPAVAEIWRHSGVTGDLMVSMFEYLPGVLMAAILLQGAATWVGLGLLWRRPGARRAAIALAALGGSAAIAARALTHYALLDLARGFPDRAAFALAADWLALQATLVALAVAAAMILLLVQPAVRRQFSSGS